MLIDIPYTKAFVSDKLLYQDQKKTTWTECYIFAATSLPNRPLLFTIHTEDGAIYSRVPIWMLCHDLKLPGQPWQNSDLQPWSCLSESITVIRHKYLKDYEAKCRSWGENFKSGGNGRYLMTFDFNGDWGLDQDPVQHKAMHMMALDNGQFALLPNNYMLFKDRHFTNSDEEPKYKRNSEYFLTEW